MDLIGPFDVIVDAYPDTDASLDTSLIAGTIVEVGVAFDFDGGSSMDVAITTKGENGPSKDILNLSGANTDGWYAVRGPLSDTDGAAIANLYNEGVVLYDRVNIAVANAGGGDKLSVWFLVEIES